MQAFYTANNCWCLIKAYVTICLNGDKPDFGIVLVKYIAKLFQLLLNRPANKEELSNLRHSQARNVIE
jgi:hypothetical protein